MLAANATLLCFAMQNRNLLDYPTISTRIWKSRPKRAVVAATRSVPRLRYITGSALTSTAATMQDSLPRTLQEWFVPR
jgi:hypothetical protein